ncbi:Ig-like domain-containing protein [Paraglaciecola hydrolytica]|nr:Ig-like domain-containing protein [Paraglaciecola hydrolytica]
MLLHKIVPCIFALSLLACGGSSESPAEISNARLAKSTSDSVGGFLAPINNEVVAGNLLLDIKVSDLDGLKSVAISFNAGSSRHVLCSSNTSCSGNEHSAMYSGIYPGAYVANAGPLVLGLWVTDQTDTQQQVASLTVDWQPQQLSGLQYTRSADGSTIDLSWNANSQLLRYNLYLAGQSGVGQHNYLQLSEGQARLALSGTSVSFTNLNAAHTYYVVLVGVDGSGESAFSQGLVIAPNSTIPNNPPQAVDDAETMLEDDSASFAPLDNDSDPEGDNISLVSALASSGQASLNGVNIDYIPLANFNGQVVIDYVIRDTLGLTDSAQIIVQVTPVNDDPVVSDDSAATLLDTPVNIDVLSNDQDPDGDSLSVSQASAQNGTVVIENDNSLTYTPDTGYVGQDTVEYEVSDGNGGTATGNVSIVISINNLPPVANDDSFPIYQNTGLDIKKSSGLLVNDEDPNGDVITVNTQPVSGPNTGTLTLGTDGSFTYFPPSGYVGLVTFSYEISDPAGETDTATVSIDVQAVPNDLTGDSLNIKGEFLYIGVGETTPGNGIGSGLYRIGDCLQVIDTVCSMEGEYVESAGSGNQPGQGGTYAFIMSYGGVGNSPVVARSVSAGSNQITFASVGDALFELSLFPASGGVIKSSYPVPGFSTLRNFGAYVTNQQVCQGLPNNQQCSIGNVGLTANSSDTGPLDRLDFIVSGYATIDFSDEPVALDDQFQATSDQALAVGVPGVLANDNDPDMPLVGDSLAIRNQIVTTFSQPIAIAVDEYRQHLYVYSGFGSAISVLDRAGQVLTTLDWQGEGANDADMDIAPEALSLANTPVPQGSLLIINGETAETEIYAVDPKTNTVIAQLNTAFGNSHVVGGAYNPITRTFFLLQDNVPGQGMGNLVAEIDPHSGAVISSFLLNASGSQFNVSYGDLDINSQTGNLYLVSSIDNNIIEYTPEGKVVRRLALPQGISGVSGLALNANSDRLWLVKNTSSSPIYELEFSNKGKLPNLVATVVSSVQHGTLSLNLDGSFVYTPTSGFVGEDSFVYQLSDHSGKVGQATVTLTVEVLGQGN